MKFSLEGTDIYTLGLVYVDVDVRIFNNEDVDTTLNVFQNNIDFFAFDESEGYLIDKSMPSSSESKRLTITAYKKDQTTPQVYFYNGTNGFTTWLYHNARGRLESIEIPTAPKHPNYSRGIRYWIEYDGSGGDKIHWLNTSDGNSGIVELAYSIIDAFCDKLGLHHPTPPTPTKQGTGIPKLDLATTGVI